MSAFDAKKDETAIRQLVFGDSQSSRNQVRVVSQRNPFATICSLSLWHAIDIDDFSTMRTFIVPRPSPTGSLYEVDFLSRHELITPMTKDKLPEGWEEWGVIQKNQLLVTNALLFKSKMLTADAFVAIPTYRFEHLVDDIDAMCSGVDIDPDEAICKVLSSPVTGYSFVEFVICDGLALKVAKHSILEYN